MSWFKPKASQEDFDYLVKMAQTQKAEISRLEGKVKALEAALSSIRISVAELENSNNHLGSLTNRQVGRTPQHCTEHSKVTQHYSDSSPDLSTVMLVSALVSDSGPSRSSSSDSYSSSSSCDSYSSSSSSDSYSSSSSDSSSSCGGE